MLSSFKGCRDNILCITSETSERQPRVLEFGKFFSQMLGLQYLFNCTIDASLLETQQYWQEIPFVTHPLDDHGASPWNFHTSYSMDHMEWTSKWLINGRSITGRQYLNMKPWCIHIFKALKGHWTLLISASKRWNKCLGTSSNTPASEFISLRQNLGMGCTYWSSEADKVTWIWKNDPGEKSQSFKHHKLQSYWSLTLNFS